MKLKAVVTNVELSHRLSNSGRSLYEVTAKSRDPLATVSVLMCKSRCLAYRPGRVIGVELKP